MYVGLRKMTSVLLVMAMVGLAGFSYVREGIGVESGPLDVRAAAVDYFLKIDGVPGESTDDKHKDEIDLLSFSWGEVEPGIQATGSSAGVARGGGAGKVSMQDFHFTMKVNKATPKLMLACASGQHIKEVVLTARKENGQEFAKWKLMDAICSSYQVMGDSTGIPTDSFSLNFGKIEFEYEPQSEDRSLGSLIRFGWDVKRNQAF